MRTKISLALSGVASWIGCAAQSLAGQPVAIVESVGSPKAGVEVMDYLEPGKIINLGGSERLVVSYFGSCVRESIAGGIVTIGNEQSTVQAGKVDRGTIRCATRSIDVSPSEAQRLGAIISRAYTGPKDGTSVASAATPPPAAPSPSAAIGRTPPPVSAAPVAAPPPTPPSAPSANRVQVVHALAPLIDIGTPGRLTIERLDQSERLPVLDITAGQLIRGRLVDFSKLPIKLVRGGVYRLRINNREMSFAISSTAEAQPTSVLSRLLRLPAP